MSRPNSYASNPHEEDNVRLDVLKRAIPNSTVHDLPKRFPRLGLSR
jgi:hypothetical protein